MGRFKNPQWSGEKLRTWALPIGIGSLWILWCVGVLFHGDGVNLVDLFGIDEFNYARAGEFGDAFGSLSSFMAALAAVGAWRAVALSRTQAFETTFYNLLGHLNNLVEGTDIQSSVLIETAAGKKERKYTNIHKGRDAFKRMVRSLRSSAAGTKEDDQLERVIRGYKSFFDSYKNDLVHYFRTLYQIILFIDGAPIDNRERYARILRAQLSDSEQVLLMYNCSVGKGREKFKRFVEKYSLLHNCSENKADHWETTILRPSFDRSAFRDNDAESWPNVGDLRKDLEGKLSSSEPQVASPGTPAAVQVDARGRARPRPPRHA